MAQDFASKRLVSLDALRGFDMFWLMGGTDIAWGLQKSVQDPVVQKVTDSLISHSEWEGVHCYDLVFPLFLFIIGVALPFSMARRAESGADRRQMVWKILRRTASLFLLGLVFNGLLKFQDWEHLRLLGVLQRMGLGYCAAAFAMLWLKPRGQAVLAAGLLVGYWAILKFVPVPGFPLGTMTPEGNVAYALDRALLVCDGPGDPEGILSTIPAVATALMGVLAGHWLRTDREGWRKALGLALAGAACLAAGYLWGLDLPLIKKIWTSSYALVAGGWSLLLLAAFYWAIDVKGWRRWAFGFVVIGLNPITIYLAEEFVDFGKTTDFLFHGLVKAFGPWESVAWGCGLFFTAWLLLYFLHRQKVYLRV